MVQLNQLSKIFVLCHGEVEEKSDLWDNGDEKAVCGRNCSRSGGGGVLFEELERSAAVRKKKGCRAYS